MQIQVLSDLHAEIDPRRARADVVDLGAELVILAGDIDRGDAGVRWAAKTWSDTPVVYVLGNHEHYGARLGEALERCRAAAAGTGVHVIERESVTIGDVRILGATLWTDHRLGSDPVPTRDHLSQHLTDYRAIEAAAGGRLSPLETEAIHLETVSWLDRVLAEPHGGPELVVTHHAPTPQALRQRDEWRAIDAAYASDLGWLLERHAPACWIHGHTHLSGECRVGRTRVVSNQRGYYGENTGWNPSLLLEL